MTPVVKTFLLVSAAYLLGGLPDGLADPEVRELANRGDAVYAIEEVAEVAPRVGAADSIPNRSEVGDT